MPDVKKEKSYKRIANLLSELQCELYKVTGSDLFNPELKKLIPTSEKNISDLLHEMGISSNLLGYAYLQCILEYLVEQDKIHLPLATHLYPLVTKKYNQPTSRIERSIRHAIEVSFEKGNTDLLYKLFPWINEQKGKVTNSEFIYRIAEYLQKGI